MKTFNSKNKKGVKKRKKDRQKKNKNKKLRRRKNNNNNKNKTKTMMMIVLMMMTMMMMTSADRLHKQSIAQRNDSGSMVPSASMQDQEGVRCTSY